MLIEPMTEKLYAMKLNGMATALEEQRKDPTIAELVFERPLRSFGRTSIYIYRRTSL